MNGLPMDDPRFDELTGAGDDVIEVARVLASARREAPADLAGVRWAAVAESEAANESAVGTPALPLRAGRRAEPRTGAQPRRPWGPQWGWVPRWTAAAVAVAVVAALWAWVLPLLTPTAVKDRRGPRGHIPSGPTAGEWAIVDQIGGPTSAIAHEGRLLLAGRGRHLEAYDLNDTDAEGRPRLLAVSPLLPGLPKAIDLAGDRAIVVLDGVPALWVFDLRTAGGLAGWFDRTVELTRWQELPTRAPLGLARIERLGAVETIYGIETPRNGPDTLTVWERHVVRDARFAPVGERRPLLQVDEVWSMDVYHRQLYIGYNSGVTVLDVADPAAGPYTFDEIDGVSSAGAVAVFDQRLYVAAEAGPRGEEGIAIFDLSQPAYVSKRTSPRRLGFVDLGLGIAHGNAIAFSVSGQRMAVAFGQPDKLYKESLRVEVVDIRDMGSPRVLQHRDVEGHAAWGMALEGEQLVLTRLDQWIGPSLDVIGLGDGDWIRAGVSPPPMRPFRSPLLASPAIESVVPWQGGTLLQSNLDVVGARFDGPPSLPPGGGDGRATFGVDSLEAALGASAGWRVPQGPSGHRRVMVQTASGERAAAIVLRDGPGRPDFGLLTWTAGDDPASWPATAEALDGRVAWQSMDTLLDADDDATSTAFDRTAWHLAVGDRYVVAAFGWMVSKRIAVYDLASPAMLPTIIDAADAVPSGFPEEYRTVRGFTVRGDLLHAFDVGNGVTQRLMPGGKLEPLAEWTPMPFGLIEHVVASERGLLIVRRDDVQLWPYDASGIPDASRARILGTAADIHPAEALTMDVAVDGDRAYIAGVTREPRVAFVREIDLAAGRLGPLAEFPIALVGEPLVAFADNRLYLYRDGFGMTVLERRAAVVPPEPTPRGATR